MLYPLLAFLYMRQLLMKDSYKLSLCEGENKEGWTEYVDETYHVAFSYPSNWKRDPAYRFRYGNVNGFFSYDAITGDDLTLDQVASMDANHFGNPYGTKPEIIPETIAGEPARLILPSSDQPAITANQAGLIVTYPKPIVLDSLTYRYFILWAHKAYILSIAKTLRFIHD